MSYQTTKLNITENTSDQTRDVLRFLCHESNNLWNTAVYKIRQAHFSSCGIREFFDKNDCFRRQFKDKKVKVSYPQLCKDFKENQHYQWLGAQQGQQVLKSVEEAFKSYNELLEMWFNGEIDQKPKLPSYRTKGGLCDFTFPRQALRFNHENGSWLLPMSKMIKEHWVKEKEEFSIPSVNYIGDTNVAEIRILPQHGKLWAELVYKVEEKVATDLDYSQALGCDPGVNNLLTCVSTLGKSFIVDGHKIKGVNAKYNKTVAKYKQGKSFDKLRNTDFYWDEYLDELTHKRSCFMRDAVNKTARFIINYCLNHRIGNIVFGWGQGIKTNCNLGSKNNQNFVQIPTARLKNRIKELAESVGINFTETEESYTSRSSFLNNDYLPVFGGEKSSLKLRANWKASGKRVKRGLYQIRNGKLINADALSSGEYPKKGKYTVRLRFNRGTSGSFESAQAV
jgi:IS605 OrfB family transposase